MKNSIYKLLIMGTVTFLTVVVGCKKEDTTKQNQITFNSTDYSIKNGYQSPGDTIINTLPKSNVYKFEVMLSGNGISYNSDSLAFIGQGNFLILTMYSLNPEFLESGTYTFDPFASEDSLTIDFGVVGINADFSFEIEENYIDISSGVVNVKKIGNIYTINFDIYTVDNKQVVGAYKGLLQKVKLKDEDVVVPPVDPPADSYFTIESIDYPLVYGALNLNDEVATNPSVFQYELDLCGPGITYDTDMDDYVGKGNVIAITLYSTSTDSLKAGTYTFDDSNQAPFTFEVSGLILNYDIDAETDEGIYVITSGTIKISRMGDDYKIIFDLTDLEGTPIKGQFYGPLDYHDFFSKKKSVRKPFMVRSPIMNRGKAKF